VSARPPLAFVGFEPSEFVTATDWPWYSEMPFELAFVNGREEEAVIDALRTDCGCMIIKEAYSGLVVPPGDIVPVTGTIRTEGKEGSFRRQIDVFLTSGEMFSAFVNYTVRATFHLFPTQIDLGQVDLSETSNDPVAQSIFESDCASLGHPVTDCPWLEAVVETSQPGRSDIWVHVRKEKLVYGRYSGRVIIPTDDQHVQSAVLYVQVDAVQPIRPVPGHVFLRSREPVEVRLISEDGGTVLLQDVSSSNEALHLEKRESSILVSNPGGLAPDMSVEVSIKDTRGKTASFQVSIMEP